MIFANEFIENKALDQLRAMYNEHGIWYEGAENWHRIHPEDELGISDRSYHFCAMCYALDIARELGYEPVYDLDYEHEQRILEWTKIRHLKQEGA